MNFDLTPSQIVAAGATYMLAKLTGKPLEQLGEILADRARLWQWKNQINILHQAKILADERGMDVGPIHLKALVPLLNGAALEDEPNLQQLWARLIANAGAKRSTVTVTAFAADFLKAISSDDAHLLNVLLAASENTDPAMLTHLPWRLRTLPSDVRGRVPIDIAQIREAAKLSDDAFYLALDNLVRFNVVTAPFSQDMDGRHVQGIYCFTHLGWEVVKLIREPDRQTSRE